MWRRSERGGWKIKRKLLKIQGRCDEKFHQEDWNEDLRSLGEEWKEESENLW